MRAVNSRVMPSAVPRLWCASSSRCSSFSATVVSSLAPSVWEVRISAANCGLVLLAVAVDPAVALLNADQRPGQVVVDEVVALPVHVHTLGRHVAGHEDPDRLVGERETLDDLLLLIVGEAAVHDVDLARLGEAQTLRQDPVQPGEGGHALREDDRAGVGFRGRRRCPAAW